MRMPIVHNPFYVAPSTAGHRFPMAKFARLIEVLIEDELTSWEDVIEPDPVPISWLESTHHPAYVAAICNQTLPPKAARRIGFPLTPALALRSRAAVGGTVLTARLALEYGIACNTAGGSHHAFADHGSGFCVFNDVAVAIRVLQAEGRLARALVIDLDVHQGDGTAAIFASDASVFTLSIHCEDNFPPRKQQSDLDIALRAGTGDAAYLEVLTGHVRGLIGRVRPDLVFLNAGVDAHADDKLGRLCLSDAGLMERDRRVLQMCRAAAVPVACVIGGGYAEDIDRLARRHAQLYHSAVRFWHDPPGATPAQARRGGLAPARSVR